MRALRAQYFLVYATNGCIVPFLSVYLAHRNFDHVQIGYVQAAGSVAAVLSPVLVTLLADTRIDARRIMSGLLLLSCAALLTFSQFQAFWPILLLYSLYSLMFGPLAPLQDGINFSLQQRRREAGLLPIPYHRIRVFGTIGFILPGIILYFLLDKQHSVSAALFTAAVFLVLAMFNSFLLPDPLIRKLRDPASVLPTKLPTVAAASAMLRSPLLVFCIATFLVQMSTVAYYTFYPIYLDKQIHLDPKWIALVMDCGVVVEILFMLSFGWLLDRLGMKRLLLLGTSCIALRMALLMLFPITAVAIGIQLFHGIMVLTLQVAPQVLLNRHSDEGYRHSMQGLYTMVIIGVARIVGNLLAGPIAEHSLTTLYGYAAALSMLGVLLLLVAFHDRHPTPTQPTAHRRPVPARV
jgi:PPP family 3-phenylpropionic acid transporter